MGAAVRRRYHEGEGRQPTLAAVRTHEQVAALMGMSRQWVVKTEAKALAKLRRSRVLRELK